MLQDTSSDVGATCHTTTAPVVTTSSNTPRLAKGGCIFCGTDLHKSFVDLGMSPLCENFLTTEQLTERESFYPLHAFVCEKCFLVQVEEYVHGEDIFGGEYAYFSSYSDSWLAHAKKYAGEVSKRLQLGAQSQVVELASNDGYLLKNFVDAGIPCLGIEPADNVAAVAVEKGVPTRVKFFGTATAQQLVDEGIQADLLIANNVLAHVPDLNDFVEGIHILLKSSGTATIEFPHLLTQMQGNQFDTIYQEHYCYFSLHSVQQVFAAHGLKVYDLQHLKTHGGSLRVFLCQAENDAYSVSEAVTAHHRDELDYGLADLKSYEQFAERTINIKHQLLNFLIQAKQEGKSVAGYGAPGKGNTLLNYCGIRTDFLDYVVDRNPYKHGKFLPGTHIPVYSPEKLAETKPDYILILPWNLKDEISEQLAYTREWGASLVVPIPELTVF
jgi:hypothetical protein